MVLFRQVHRSLTFTTFYCLLEKKPDVLSCNREIRIPFRFVNGITFTVVNGIISLYFCYQSGHLLKGLSFVPHLPYRTPEKIRSPYRCQFKKIDKCFWTVISPIWNQISSLILFAPQDGLSVLSLQIVSTSFKTDQNCSGFGSFVPCFFLSF